MAATAVAAINRSMAGEGPRALRPVDIRVTENATTLKFD